MNERNEALEKLNRSCIADKAMQEIGIGAASKDIRSFRFLRQ